jgi:hypothetical protein
LAYIQQEKKRPFLCPLGEGAMVGVRGGEFLGLIPDIRRATCPAGESSEKELKLSYL